MADNQKRKNTSEKPAHTYTKVEGKTRGKEELLAQTKKNATPYRIAAVILWILALVSEVMAILCFTVRLDWGVLYEEPGHTVAWIVALVLDLVFLVIGSLLWKKGNHLDPAKKSQQIKFWLQNNLGVIVAAVAFIPFLIFALTDKNATKKSKTLAAIAAVVGLLIGVLFGIALSKIIANLAEVPVSISTKAIVVSVVFSTVVGIVFGLLPSIKAANLNPIDALRYE